MSGPERFHLTQSAETDLEEIAGYLHSVATPAVVERIVGEVVATIHLLSRYPRAGRLVPNMGRRVRKFACRPYLIYYRPKPDAIEILHIFHGRRDQSEARRWQ